MGGHRAGQHGARPAGRCFGDRSHRGENLAGGRDGFATVSTVEQLEGAHQHFGLVEMLRTLHAAPRGEHPAGATGQRKRPQLHLAWIVAATHEEGAGCLVDADERPVGPVGGREGAHKRTRRFAQLHLPSAAPLGRPEELPGAFQPERCDRPGIVVEVEPGGIGLAQQFVRVARGGIGEQQDLFGLLAILHKQGERTGLRQRTQAR